MTPGTTYIESGKFDLKRTLIFTLLGCIASYFIGYFYAWVTTINPFIYLNFLVLLIAFFLLVMVLSMVKTSGRSRNRAVDIITNTAICFFAWYVHWCFIYADFSGQGVLKSITEMSNVISFVFDYPYNHTLSIGRFGGSGAPISGSLLMVLYFIELIVFLAAAYMSVKANNYYCENCKTTYEERTGFTENIEFTNNTSLAEKGNFVFLSDASIVKDINQLQADPNQSPQIFKLEFHYCDKCKENSIMNFSSAVLKLNNKGQRETEKEKKLIKNTYIDRESNSILQEKIA